MNRKMIFCLLMVLVVAFLVGCDPLVLQATLEMNVIGQGTVVPAQGTHTYNQGESVALHATPAAGWKFDGWSGSVTGTQNPVNLIMNGNKSVIAIFSQDVTGTYSLDVTVQGQGIVTKTPNASTYAAGTQVTLQATPAAGWKFNGWSGSITGTQNPTTLIMNGNKSVVATFIQDVANTYTVNVSVQGQGTVTKTPNAATYAAGTQVTLQATPANGWVFKQWLGDLVGGANPTTIVANQNYSITAVFEESQASQYKWNFLVYLDADNDLEEYGIEDVNEMEKVGSTDDVNVLVLLDRSPQYDTSNGNWSGTRLYRITKDVNNSSNIVSQLVHDYGELDMSDPITLYDFIVYCQTNYPAERTMLTLWDHGAGVSPKSMFPPSGGKNGKNTTGGGGISTPQGICWDDTTGSDIWDCLTTDEVAQALSSARGATGQKINILNMDACLMQMIEVAYEWRQEIDFLVGSEETVPGYGNEYGSVLSSLNGNPTMTSEAASKMLVDAFYNFYSVNGEGTETYSSLALDYRFNTFINSFKTFATALNNTPDMDGVFNAWKGTRYFTSNEYNDLYHFAGNLVKNTVDSTVKSAATALQQTLNQTVIHHKETQTYVGTAFGLTVFLPTSEEWVYYSGQNQYRSLKLSLDSDWDEFVVKFADYTSEGGGSQTDPQALNISMSWSYGDCDLGVEEPDGSFYEVSDRSTPNGLFSSDMQDGGTESWTILQNHDDGIYNFYAYSYDYTGTIDVVITCAGQIYTGSLQITEEEEIQLGWADVGVLGTTSSAQLILEKTDRTLHKRSK